MRSAILALMGAAAMLAPGSADAAYDGLGGKPQGAVVLDSQERDLLRPKPAAPGQALGADSDDGRPVFKGGPGQIHILSEYGYLDYDEEANQIYARERTKIQYEDLYLEADRWIIDIGLQEAQAEGRVLLQREGQTLNCDSLRYNFRLGTGVAYNATGQMDVLYFSVTDHDDQASMEMVSKEESLFRDAKFTSCDFPIPMYYFRSKEVIVFVNQRVMMRSATLVVRDMPVFYLPFYTRSLSEGTPWFFRVGVSSRVGAFIRVGYSFRHHRQTPSWDDDTVREYRSRGHMDVFADTLSKRGSGAGVDYKYEFDFDRHRGEIKLYANDDGGRDVQGEDDFTRWTAYARHHSRLTDDSYLQVIVDEFSDPDVYYDIVDRFNEFGRDRLPERRARAAVTLNRDQYIARLNLEVKDRIGRDRFRDFSNSGDDNLDFDVEPLVPLDDKEDNGVSKDRWGRVSEKIELQLASNQIRLTRSTPLFYRIQLNLFNNLDRGLNIVSKDEFTALNRFGVPRYTGNDTDAYVQGADLYQSLMHTHRFNERVTWTNQAGLGVGIANRTNSDQDLVDGSRGFAGPGVITGGKGFYDGLWFTDPNTFHIGRSDVLKSYDDINGGFFYADAQSRLEARFTDALTGTAIYRVRETTEDYIGDWYARMGDDLNRADLYNFPIREHWLEGQLVYRLLYPGITVFTGAGRNLTSMDELFPNEELWFYRFGGNYATQDQRFHANGSLRFSEKQFFHPNDPRAFSDNVVSLHGSGTYTDPSEIWWARLSTRWANISREDLDSSSSTSLFEEDFIDVTPSIGTRIGPKWSIEGETTYDFVEGVFDDVKFALNRDLHDALLAFRVKLDKDIFDTTAKEEEDGVSALDNIEVGLTLSPKLPHAEAEFGIRRRETLSQQFRALELDG